VAFGNVEDQVDGDIVEGSGSEIVERGGSGNVEVVNTVEESVEEEGSQLWIGRRMEDG
jgi:hypothetical protein